MLRRKRDSAEGGVDLGIIITPMLDMAFQLLAFFIMTYHPTASEAVVDGSLLPAEPGKASLSSGNSGLLIYVKATTNLEAGQPKEIFLTRPNGIPQLIAVIPGVGHLDREFAVAVELLEMELARLQALPGMKDLPLSVEADRALRYRYVIAVQDVARKSGFQRIELRVANGAPK